MRIEPHANLYITLLRRNLYGSLRLRGSAKAYPPPPRDLACLLRLQRSCRPGPCPPPTCAADLRQELCRPVEWHHEVAAWQSRGDTPPATPAPVRQQSFYTPASDVLGKLVDVLA